MKNRRRRGDVHFTRGDLSLIYAAGYSAGICSFISDPDKLDSLRNANQTYGVDSRVYNAHIDVIVAYKPVARQKPRNEQRVQPLLCNRRINTRPLLGNGSVNTPTTIEDVLKAVFSVGSSPRLYNVNPRPTELITVS
jgi:hypothetical protein